MLPLNENFEISVHIKLFINILPRFKNWLYAQGLGCQILTFGINISSGTINCINLIHQQIISIKYTAKIRLFRRFKKVYSLYIEKSKGTTVAILDFDQFIGVSGSQAIFKLFLLSAYLYLTRSRLEIDQMTSPYRLLLFTCRI
jgi:hypothetical protein